MKKLALVTAAALALAAAPATAAPKELGLNVHQSTDVGLDITKAANLRWVRIDVNWFDAEKTKGVYDWAVLDQVVDGAKSRGLSVLAVLAYTPAWASQANVDGKASSNDVPKVGTYPAFVTAAVTHFAGRVTHYEMWNEPNLGDFFEGTPKDYTDRILVPGADAVHAACATCKVVAPGLASLASGKYDEWLDASLVAAMPKIDIVSGHVYAGFPQDGAGGTSDNFYNRLEKHRIVKLGDTVVYEGPRSFKEVMDARGAKQPFWLTETGLEAPLGDAPKLAAQTRYYRRVLESMLTRGWWTNTIFYEAFDESVTTYRWGVALHGSGASFQEKPVMAFLRQATGKQLLFGGNGTDCEDGLDNEGDGLIDFPADPDCITAKSTSEGAPPIDAGVGDDAGDAGDPAVPSGDTGGCNASGGGVPFAPAAFAALGLMLFRRRRASLAVLALVTLGGCSKKATPAELSAFIAPVGSSIPAICTKENDGKRFVVRGHLSLPESVSIDEKGAVDLELHGESVGDASERSAQITVRNGTDIDDLMKSATGRKAAGYRTEKASIGSDALRIHTTNGEASAGDPLELIVEIETIENFQTKAVSGCLAHFVQAKKL